MLDVVGVGGFEKQEMEVGSDIAFEEDAESAESKDSSSLV